MSTAAEVQTPAVLLEPPLASGLPSPLLWSLVFASLLHLALILGLTLSIPRLDRPVPDSMLEVRLLNDSGELVERPPDAAALARLNRRGESSQGDAARTFDGARPLTPDEPQGDADRERRVEAPAEPDAARADLGEVTAERAAPLATLEPPEAAEQPPTAIESALGEAPALAGGHPSEVRPVIDAAHILASATDEIARLSADLQARADAYASRERRRSISASTREFRYASYLGAWARKVERIGTINYPQAAKEQQLFGSLILHVAVRADGSVERIRVVRSSGYELLDEAAIHIVELAAPFAPFPPDIAAEADVLDIVRTWQFLRGGGLGWDQ